jgi:hypothetical protein
MGSLQREQKMLKSELYEADIKSNKKKEERIELIVNSDPLKGAIRKDSQRKGQLKEVYEETYLHQGVLSLLLEFYDIIPSSLKSKIQNINSVARVTFVIAVGISVLFYIFSPKYNLGAILIFLTIMYHRYRSDNIIFSELFSKINSSIAKNEKRLEDKSRVKFTDPTGYGAYQELKNRNFFLRQDKNKLGSNVLLPKDII